MKTYIYLFLACILSSHTTINPEKKGKIFLSRDRGDSWLAVDARFPEDANINSWILSSSAVIAVTEEHGVYISDDGLKTWHSSNSGLPAGIKIKSIVNHKNYLFIGTVLFGVYVSTNQGASWKPSSAGLPGISVRAFYSSGNRLIAGTDSGVFISDNNGGIWTGVMYGTQVNSFTQLNGSLFAATSRGVLRSQDLGKSWEWAWSGRAMFNIAAEGKSLISVDPGRLTDRPMIGSEDGTSWVYLDSNFSRYTFRITPKSLPIAISPWKNKLNALINNTAFPERDLPEGSFGTILETPYGILITMNVNGC